VHTDKSLATVLAETREELKEFVTTRVEILTAELKEKISTWKQAIPFLLIAASLLFAGWMTLTFALVALLHVVFIASAYSWFFAGLIVAVFYLLVGGLVGWFAYGELTETGLKPTRTLEVLKQDQVWIQNEARTIWPRDFLLKCWKNALPNSACSSTTPWWSCGKPSMSGSTLNVM
jgi:uncharacterized membrane protein YqjE